jgi:hypothetical protein
MFYLETGILTQASIQMRNDFVDRYLGLTGYFAVHGLDYQDLWNQVRKSRHNPTWGYAPLRLEPDHIQWSFDKRFEASIKRTQLGTLCGYLTFPVCPKMITNDLEVHGGVTSHQTWTNDHDEAFERIGFDTSHYLDYLPGLDHIFGAAEGTYRTFEYVFKELVDLKIQVSDLFVPWGV